MGFFDKLREMVDSVLESGDSPKKKYYDFTLNLLSTAKRLTKEDIKKCYRVKMGEDCDDAVLEAVLTKFDTSTEPRTKETWYERTIKQEFDEKIPASLLLFKNADEVYDICFVEFRESIRVRFAEVLEAVKNCPDSIHLDRAIHAMITLPGADYPHERIAWRVAGEEIVKRFYANDPTVTAIVEQRICGHLARAEKKDDLVTRIYAVVLRALHFEKYGKEVDSYSSITEGDCKNAVLNSQYYKKKFENEPYYKDSIVAGAASRILKDKAQLSCPMVGWAWDRYALEDNHFVDALCHFVWKKITSEYEDGDTRDVEEIVDILYDYTQNSAD